VRELEAVYRYREIDRTTRFIGVTGFGDEDAARLAVVNAGLAHLGLGFRCLPLAVGSVDLFRKVIVAVKLAGVIIADQHRAELFPIAGKRASSAEAAQSADLLVRQNDVWTAHNTLGESAVAALEASLRPHSPRPDQPLQGRMVMIAGANPLAVALATVLNEHGAILMIASRDKENGLRLAQELGCRYVPFEALYSTSHDVLVRCAEERLPLKKGSSDQTGDIHPGYLKPSITVLDLTALPRLSEFAKAARDRGCPVVRPRQLLVAQCQRQVHLLSGKDVPREVLLESLNANLGDDEE
jgi:shikimate 5-dehydrogenase